MNTSYAFDSANPVVLALAYHWRRRQGLDSNRDDHIRDTDYSIPIPPRRRSHPGLHSNPGGIHRPLQRSRRSGGGSVFKSFLKAIVAILLVLLILAFLAGGLFIYWARGQMQDYVPMHGGDTLVAQIYSTQQGDHMKIHLILFDNRGHEYADENCDDCIKPGNTVLLKGDMIGYSGWLSHFLYSGYKLTVLKAYYNNSDRAKNQASEDVALNGSDDALFQDMQKWGSTIGAEATVSNSVIVPADGRTYNVLISPTKGLYIEPVKTVPQQ